MQLGTRWAVGSTPPGRLSPLMVEAITGVENGLADADKPQLRWTLTWLEGHPVAELDPSPSSGHAGGTIVREGPGGGIVVLRGEADDSVG